MIVVSIGQKSINEANKIQQITIDINENTSVLEIAAATSLESAGN
jgi:hypothetical protein